MLEGTKEQLRPVILAGFRGMPSSSGGGAVPILLPAEVEALFGAENLRALCEAAKFQVGADLAREPHRAEVRVAEWLDRELTAVYPLLDVGIAMKPGSPGPGLAALGDLITRRQFPALAKYRDVPTPGDGGVVLAGGEALKIPRRRRPADSTRAGRVEADPDVRPPGPGGGRRQVGPRGHPQGRPGHRAESPEP